MNLTVAIQSDDYRPGGKAPERDVSSPRWARLLESAGHEVRWVDVYRPDILQQITGCQAFMWRWAHFGGMFQIARRLLPVIEREMKLPVYPDQNTCWHYDDKVAQAYLFQTLGVPAPRTWAWFSESGVREWIQTAEFPLVLKLAGGAGSKNVTLVGSPAEGEFWVNQLFREGVTKLGRTASLTKPWTWRLRATVAAKALLHGQLPSSLMRNEWPIEKNYALFQEYLPDNQFDTRVTVIGRRAFGFRRFNRPDDFRASGSGRIDWTPENVDAEFVRLAFDVAARLNSQSCAIDGVYDRNRRPVTVEVSYTYASWAVRECPGHWELDGDPWSGSLRWIEGHMWPEEAQIADFLGHLGEDGGIERRDADQ